MQRHLVAAVVLVVAASALGACGHTKSATQPAPHVAKFQPGVFDSLPLPPRAKPIGKRNDQGSTTARSYAVTGLSPSGILDFYTRTLTDWQSTEPPHAAGTSTLRGVWTKGADTLEVAAYSSTALDRGSSEGVVSQLSLLLRSNGAAAGS